MDNGLTPVILKRDPGRDCGCGTAPDRPLVKELSRSGLRLGSGVVIPNEFVALCADHYRRHGEERLDDLPVLTFRQDGDAMIIPMMFAFGSPLQRLVLDWDQEVPCAWLKPVPQPSKII